MKKPFKKLFNVEQVTKNSLSLIVFEPNICLNGLIIYSTRSKQRNTTDQVGPG